MSAFYEAVYKLVREIPRGRVMTYGQIATILGCPRSARAVGYALKASGAEETIPWQRVINSQGGISGHSEPVRPTLQRHLLEQEGVVFSESGLCDLNRFRWEPARPKRYLFMRLDDLPFR